MDCFVTVPLYKAWDVKRIKRKAIVADGFDDFVCKGKFHQ